MAKRLREELLAISEPELQMGFVAGLQRVSGTQEDERARAEKQVAEDILNDDYERLARLAIGIGTFVRAQGYSPEDTELVQEGAALAIHILREIGEHQLFSAEDLPTDQPAE